jgi:hypothetical protein
MKTTMIAVCFVFCLLCVTSAFAQSAAVLSNNPAMIVIPDHPQRASQHDMAQYDNLRGSDAYTYVQGEQPLWEYASDKHETPLGDVARAYRKDHMIDRKATIVMEKQQ